jgi:hypothetical protein
MVLIALGAMPARSAEIVGQVMNQDRVPVAGQQLSVVNQAGLQIAMTTSDGAGGYSFHGIAPGTYTLSLKGESAVAYVPADGLTLNWGVARNSPPIAVARPGVAIHSNNVDAAVRAPK